MPTSRPRKFTQQVTSNYSAGGLEYRSSASTDKTRTVSTSEEGGGGIRRPPPPPLSAPLPPPVAEASKSSPRLRSPPFTPAAESAGAADAALSPGAVAAAAAAAAPGGSEPEAAAMAGVTGADGVRDAPVDEGSAAAAAAAAVVANSTRRPSKRRRQEGDVRASRVLRMLRTSTDRLSVIALRRDRGSVSSRGGVRARLWRGQRRAGGFRSVFFSITAERYRRREGGKISWDNPRHSTRAPHTWRSSAYAGEPPRLQGENVRFSTICGGAFVATTYSSTTTSLKKCNRFPAMVPPPFSEEGGKTLATHRPVA